MNSNLQKDIVTLCVFYFTRLGLYQWSENVIRSVTRTDWDVSQGQIDYTVKMLVTRKVVVSNMSTLDIIMMCHESHEKNHSLQG